MSSNVARQVAREFGYSHAAIDFCCRGNPHLNAGELVDKLWELDDGGMANINGKYEFDIYEKYTKNELREETLILLLEKLCLKCRKNNRCVLSMPCSCFAECETCSSDICFRCNQTVSCKYHVFH